MPDVVRYVYYELLTTFLGAVAAPLLISDSDFGPEQIVPAAGTIWFPEPEPEPLQRLPFGLCILALHMHSYMRNIPKLKASLAFKSRLAFCIGIHVTLLARVSPVNHQREVSRVFQRKKRNAI